MGIGADGAPCNNRLDAWGELRLAAQVAATRSGPGSLSGVDALRLATSEGARALRLDAEIGSIEVGKRADLVLWDTDEPAHIPYWIGAPLVKRVWVGELAVSS